MTCREESIFSFAQGSEIVALSKMPTGFPMEHLCLKSRLSA